jgi:hypothetical protein
MPIDYQKRAQALLDAAKEIGGFTTKKDRKSVVEVIGRAFDEVMDQTQKRTLAMNDARLAHVEHRQHRMFNDEENALLDHPYGTHNWRPKHATLYARWPDLVARAQALVALRAEAVGLPEIAKPKSKARVQEEQRLADAMTCQCCGRPILAETGQIAHHGYQRPGHGYQTQSCYGARHEPFEASRERLGQYIDNLERRIADMKANRDEIASEKRPLAITYRTGVYDYRTGRHEEATVTFTRTTLAYALYFAPRAFAADSHIIKPDGTVLSGRAYFDLLKARDIERRNRRIHDEEVYLVAQQVRFNDWEQTHTRVGDAWVKL